MRIKQDMKRLLLAVMAALCLPGAGTMAQTGYFRIINGIPHLPVYANTAAVASPLPGSLVFTTDDNKPMLYNGQVWDDFCSQLLPVATGSKTFFSVIDGVPVMPVKAAVTGASTSGDFYWPLNGTGLRINNGTSWSSPANMPPDLLPSTTEVTIMGTSAEVTGGFVMPVLAADPAGAEQGAIYMNSVTKKPVVYNGTAWATLPCLCSPQIYASVEGDWNVLNPLLGAYSYYQKDNFPEAASGMVHTWYLADDANGANKAQVGTGDSWTSWDYTMNGKYIQYEVLTKTTTGLYGRGVSAWAKMLNCPPQVSDPYIYPATAVFLTPSITFGLEYAYEDRESNTEATPDIKWYIADDATGTNKVLKASSVDYEYTFNVADNNKYLLATITPMAAAGFITGDLKQVLPARAVKILNCPPNAGLTINGDYVFFNTPLTFSHSYSDKEADAENVAGAIYRYFISTGANGTGTVTPLATGADYVYNYQTAHDGLYLNVGLQVAAIGGALLSDEVFQSVLLKNCPPQVAAQGFIDNSVALDQLTGYYAYYDREGNAEGTSMYEWWQANDAAGNGATLVGTADTYTLASGADYNKYYSFRISPVAAGGYPTGTQVSTAYTLVANCAPQVTGVRIDGTLTVGSTLNVGYAYYDKENQTEGVSEIQWYRDNTSDPIAGATAASYMLTAADQGHTIGVSITPKAATGISTGDLVSAFTTATVP